MQSHVSENNDSFNGVTTQLSQTADRVSIIETALTSINANLVTISAKIDSSEQKLNKLDAILGSPDSLEQAPTISVIRDEVTALKLAFGDTPATLQGLMSAVQGITSQLGDKATFEEAPTIIKLKADVTALECCRPPVQIHGWRCNGRSWHA